MLGMSSRFDLYVDLFSSLSPGVLSVHVALYCKLIDEDHLYPFSLHLQIEVDELEFQSNTDFKRIRIEDMISFVISYLQVFLHVSSYWVAHRYLDVWKSLYKLSSNNRRSHCMVLVLLKDFLYRFKDQLSVSDLLDSNRLSLVVEL